MSRRWNYGGGGGGGTKGLAQLHDTTHTPVALWQLQGDLTDASGNGYDLSLGGGTTRYTSVMPGIQGFLFDQATYLSRASTAALQIGGDVTVEMILAPNLPGSTTGTGAGVLIRCGGPGTSTADNIQYAMQGYILTASEALFQPRYFAEQTPATVFTYEPTSPRVSFQPNGPSHVAMVRSSNEVQFYSNGLPLGAVSSGLAAPDGGTSAGVTVGAGIGADYYQGAIASVKVIASALSADDIKAEYNRTLGPALGELS